MTNRFESHSIEETIEFAKSIAGNANPGDVYALIGEMGVGKTVFAKAFAMGLDIKETVNSPTFTIVQEYTDGRVPMYHFDLYRIAEEEELEEIGFDDYLDGEGVCLIEWADLFMDALPKDTKIIQIERTGENSRIITL